MCESVPYGNVSRSRIDLEVRMCNSIFQRIYPIWVLGETCHVYHMKTSNQSSLQKYFWSMAHVSWVYLRHCNVSIESTVYTHGIPV